MPCSRTPGGLLPRVVGSAPGGCLVETPPAVGGTHPTGMHSCSGMHFDEDISGIELVHR